MIGRYVVFANDLAYTVIDDFTSTFQELVHGLVTDEIAGAPPIEFAAVTVDRPDLVPKFVEGGLFAISGYPERIATPLNVLLTVRVAGYVPATIPIPIPAVPVYPIDAGTVAVRRQPVRLQGRVVENTGARLPIPNASVDILTANTFAARSPIHFDHGSGVTVRSRALTPSGAPKTLATVARSASSDATLNNVGGLASGNLLRFGDDIDAEYAVIDTLGPAPNQVLLTSPLRRTFAAGTTVQRTTRGAIGTTTTLSRSANSGDALLLLAGPLPLGTIEIVDGTSTEYNISGALTDAQGFYRFDGIGGLRQVDVQAAAAGFTSSPVTPVFIDYTQPATVLSFRL